MPDFNNPRVSYFLGLLMRESNPNPLLAGDRDLASGQGSLIWRGHMQQNKPSRTGKRAIQLAGSAVESSLGLDLILFPLILFSRDVGGVFWR